MLKISDALREILKDDDLLRFGLNHQLLNLSQTAKFIKPLIEARLQKEVQVPAIVVSLSRFQQSISKQDNVRREYKIENLSIQSNLGTLSFSRSPKTHETIYELSQKVHKEKGHFMISEGASQITIITDRKYMEQVRENVSDKPIFEHDHISGITVGFGAEYLDFPGLSYHLMQKLTLQNVNLVEYSSTCTEITFFVDDNEVSLAFETLRQCF